MLGTVLGDDDSVGATGWRVGDNGVTKTGVPGAEGIMLGVDEPRGMVGCAGWKVTLGWVDFETVSGCGAPDGTFGARVGTIAGAAGAAEVPGVTVVTGANEVGARLAAITGVTEVTELALGLWLGKEELNATGAGGPIGDVDPAGLKVNPLGAEVTGVTGANEGFVLGASLGELEPTKGALGAGVAGVKGVSVDGTELAPITGRKEATGAMLGT